MKPSVKVLVGHLKTESDSRMHSPVLRAVNVTERSVGGSVSRLLKMGYSEDDARKLVGLPPK